MPVDADDHSYVYEGTVPVFYGHYWREDEPHELNNWTTNSACVDFSIVKGGTLVAYRFDGVLKVDPEHYHPHGGQIVLNQPSK